MTADPRIHLCQHPGCFTFGCHGRHGLSRGGRVERWFCDEHVPRDLPPRNALSSAKTMAILKPKSVQQIAANGYIDPEWRLLPALSIMQPWPFLITRPDLTGENRDQAITSGMMKDIENRDWKTNFRGQLLIHAGLKFDGGRGAMTESPWPGIPAQGHYSMGGIVGMAEIVDCVEASDSQWFFGRYGFVLRNARPLPFRPCKGQLGFFKPDYDSRYGAAKEKPGAETSAAVPPAPIAQGTLF